MHILIEIVGKIILFVCSVWVLSLFSIFFHELGHAIGYTLATGDRSWHIQIGQGKKLLDTKALTVKWYVLEGFFMPDEKRINSDAQLVMMLSGGPIVSLLLVIGLAIVRFGRIFVITSGTVRFVLTIGLIINSLILLWSLIPARGFFSESEETGTDALQIINALKHRQE